MNKINQFMNHTFGRRIAVYFMPAIIVLILVISIISNYIYYTWFLQESQQNIKGMVKQGNYTMDLYFQDIKTTVVLLAESDELVYMLTNYEKMDIQEKFYTQEDVDKIFQNTSLMQEHILDCIVIGNNGYQTNMPDRAELKENADILNSKWMKDCRNPLKKGFYYTGVHPSNYYYRNHKNNKNVISVVFPVIRYGNCRGYIMVDLDFLKMNEIVNAGNQTSGFQYLVVDHSGKIVFSDEQAELNEKLSDNVRKKLETDDSFFFNYHGKQMFCVHEESSATKWEFLVLTAKERMTEPGARVQKILFLGVLPLFIGITILLSLKLSNRIKRPLEEIVEQLEQMDVDRFTHFAVKNSVGEIDYLAEKITEMSSRITRLINQVYKAEIKSKDAQIEALISQINPHFLYNTLQLIKTKSIKGETEEVGDTINCLSSFLRYTIDNKKLYVTLLEELDYIRAYIEIYKKRFPEKYTLMIYAENQVLENIIPKLTLQPIVENAVKHGMSKKNGAGIIQITVTDGADMMIVIEDNGVGLDEKSLERLFKKIHSKDDAGSHIGLRNVQERLQLDGGREYGIVKMESKEGENFKVYIRVKKEKQG